MLFMEKEFDLAGLQQKAIKEMCAGKPLNGIKGRLAPLRKHFLEAARAGKNDSPAA